MRVIAECLTKSNTAETQQAACALLESLCHGNPEHKHDIYKALIALMSCTSPKAKQLVLRSLRTVQVNPQSALTHTTANVTATVSRACME